MKKHHIVLGGILLCHLVILCPSCGKKKQDKEVAERRDNRLLTKNRLVKNDKRAFFLK